MNRTRNTIALGLGASGVDNLWAGSAPGLVSDQGIAGAPTPKRKTGSSLGTYGTDDCAPKASRSIRPQTTDVIDKRFFRRSLLTFCRA
jgi:hypothetical protein